MSFAALLWIAVGLAMDATAVAAARGLAAGRVRLRDALGLALLFGAFQAGMPAIGWLIGVRAGGALAAWDHWVAFVILAGLGAKMLIDAWRVREPAAPDAKAGQAFRLTLLVPLAIATSIDALAAGFTLPLLDAPFALSIATIGVVTALLCLAGVYAGRRLGAGLGRRLDAAGGVALIALGTKILIEHLLAG